ncbi:MAG: hypothetical protein Q9161_008196 [Pseudevernia consocians]
MAASGSTTLSPRSSTSVSKDRFSGPASTHTFSGILSDMDGTLIDSTNAIVKHWERKARDSIGREYNIDPAAILATAHGRRSIDVLQQIDPSHATWAYVCELERQLPLKYGHDAVEVPGARQLLQSLDRLSTPWAIVTSGTRPLVDGWLRILNLSPPTHMVTAETVSKGKPDPECYALGVRKLGISGHPSSSERVLVLEDAPAGIRAGKAAGCRVLAVATTHAVGELRAAGADWIVEDLRSVGVRGGEDGRGEVVVEIRDVFVG